MTRVWTQSFVLAKQVLSHLNHTSSPFCSGYFGGGVLYNYLPGWPQTEILLISVSQEARIIGMSLWHLAWNIVSLVKIVTFKKKNQQVPHLDSVKQETVWHELVPPGFLFNEDFRIKLLTCLWNWVFCIHIIDNEKRYLSFHSCLCPLPNSHPSAYRDSAWIVLYSLHVRQLSEVFIPRCKCQHPVSKVSLSSGQSYSCG
jgi:hypothetical protein